MGFCQDVQLGCPDESIRAFFTKVSQGQGFIPQEAWVRELQAADLQSQELLATRGISSVGTAGHSTAGVPVSNAQLDEGLATTVDEAANMLAAALIYNELSPAEGFDVLDIDEDGKISLADLRSAAATLALNIADEALGKIPAQMNLDASLLSGTFRSDLTRRALTHARCTVSHLARADGHGG